MKRKGLIVLLSLVLVGVAFAATRQSESCADGTYHQNGYCPADLTAVSATNVADTTATARYSIDRSDGTTYNCVVETGSEKADCDTVKTCSGAIQPSNDAVDASGTRTVSVTGLTASTAYKSQHCNENPSLWQSDMVTSPQFTTTSGGGGGSHAYFISLRDHSNAVLTKAFSTATEHSSGDPAIELSNSYLDPSSGAYEADEWDYDATVDAARQTWDAREASKSTGEQLRWGNTAGYNEVEPVSFGTLGTGTFLFVWEFRFHADWELSNRQAAPAGDLENMKAFQLSQNTAAGDDRVFEPRWRYTGTTSTGQVAFNDTRGYVQNKCTLDAICNQIAKVYAVPERWIRLFYFVDGNTTELSVWAHEEQGSVTLLIDKESNFGDQSVTDRIQGIDNFWVEMNSSQTDSGIDNETYTWFRNWVVLDDLTYAEAEALVQQSSW